MADLDPDDIKEPEEEEEPVVPPTPKPEEEEEPPAEDEEEKQPPDLAAAAYHLTVAVAELARASGSPPAVTAALQQARSALGK